jgi:hypothetical protein
MKTIHPVTEEILRALIDLADHPRDVATTSEYPTLAVNVPDDLYARYETYKAIDSSPPKEPKKSGAKK